MTGPRPRKAKKLQGRQNKSTSEQRHKLFAEAYLSNNGNATQAALDAGFSPKTAACQGSRLLKNVKIKQYLDSRRAEVLTKVGLTTERTLLEVARLAYSDPRKFYNADGSLKSILELDDDAAATIASVEWDEIKSEGVVVGLTRKVKQWDKGQALDKAMKHLGLYEKDNEQPNAELAEAIKDSGMALLKARFSKVLAQ